MSTAIFYMTYMHTKDIAVDQREIIKLNLKPILESSEDSMSMRYTVHMEDMYNR